MVPAGSGRAGHAVGQILAAPLLWMNSSHPEILLPSPAATCPACCCSFPNPEKADTVHRRQALVGFHTWCEDWSNASCPRDEAACTAQLEVGG